MLYICILLKNIFISLELKYNKNKLFLHNEHSNINFLLFVFDSKLIIIHQKIKNWFLL